MRIICYCIASSINLVAMEAHYKLNSKSVNRIYDLLYISEPGDETNKRCFYFKNGTIIIWNANKYEAEHYLDLVKPFCDEILPTTLKESYLFHFGEKLTIRPHNYFNVDMLTVPEDDFELILSLSFAFSLSMLLYKHEKQMKSLVTQYTPIIKNQSTTGKIKISRAKCNKIIGEILEVISSIPLAFHFPVFQAA